MNRKKRIIVMAGGTGGHIIPGITVSHYLIDHGWKVCWLGTMDRMESILVPKFGIKICFIRIFGLRGKGMKSSLLGPMHIFNAWRQARFIMKRFNPNVVLGMGGYVSGPGGLAAWLLNIPIVLHEQNSVAGLTNKWLSKISNKVLQAFPGTFSNAETVGNPINANIRSLSHPKIRLKNREGPLRILIIGGSQGALILNQTIPKVAEKLKDKAIIWHQSGKGNQQKVEQAYFKVGQIQHKITEFIDDMAVAYGWADVIICRSGALTVSEITAVGLAAIFVPFQHKDRHQYWNALPLEKARAAKIFDQKQFTADSIVETLSSWNRTILLEMANRSRDMVTPDATERIAQELNRIAKT